MRLSRAPTVICPADSESGRMVLNFHSLKCLPSLPTRICPKNAPPLLSNTTAIANSNSTGLRMIRKKNANKKSKILFMMLEQLEPHLSHFVQRSVRLHQIDCNSRARIFRSCNYPKHLDSLTYHIPDAYRMKARVEAGNAH